MGGRRSTSSSRNRNLPPSSCPSSSSSLSPSQSTSGSCRSSSSAAAVSESLPSASSSVISLRMKKMALMMSLVAMAMVQTVAHEGAHEKAMVFSWGKSDTAEFEYMHEIRPASGLRLYYSDGTVWAKFGLTAPAGRWVGIGWSHECEMEGDGVIAAFGDEAMTPVAYALPSDAMPELDPGLTRVINSAKTNVKEGLTILEVNRTIEGGKVAINGTHMCVIWAYGGDHSRSYHGPDHRGAVLIWANGTRADEPSEEKSGASGAAATFGKALLAALALATLSACLVI